MNHKEKIKLQQASKISQQQKTPAAKATSWEMNAEDALKVDYVNRKKPFSTQA